MLDRLDLDTEKPSAEELAKKFGFEDDYYSGNLSWWQKTKPKHATVELMLLVFLGEKIDN